MANGSRLGDGYAKPPHSPRTSIAPVTDSRAGVRSLSGDRIWIGTTSIVLIAIIPTLLPVVGEDAQWLWRWIYVDVPIAVAVFLAVWLGSGAVVSPTERRFWRLIAAARLIVVLIEVVNATLPERWFTSAVDMAVESGYLLYYAFFFSALGVAAGRAEDRGQAAIDRIRTFAVVTMALAAVVYFQIVPVSFSDEPPGWSPGLYTFAVLDLVLFASFLGLRRRVEDPRWRSILLGFAAVNAAWAVLDAAEATLYLPGMIDAELHVLWDMPWHAGELLLIFVARQHLSRPHIRSVVSHSPPVPPSDRGELVAALLSLPLAHGVLYSRGVLDPDLRTVRERVVAVFILVMSVQAVRYVRLLGGQRERARLDAQLAAERYRTFVENRTDALFRGEPDQSVPVDSGADALLSAMSRTMTIAEASGGSAIGGGAADLVGSPMTRVLGSPADARRLVDRWYDADCGTASVEVEVKGDGGERRVIECALTGIVANGRLLRVWVTHVDRTDARRAAERAHEMEQELEHARRMETVGTLAGGIAHDFNNLLTPIIGYTELAASEAGNDEDEVRENLGLVLEASHRAAALVEQMLAVTRQEPSREEVVHLQDVVRTAMRLLRPGIPSNVKLDVSLDHECPPVVGDPSRLHQVVMNLCTNGAHAVGTARGRVQVELSYDPESDRTDAPHGWAVLRVRDDGEGMESRVRRRVFEPFFTTKDPGAGNGLGLSVVHGIVVGHGGRIAVESAPGSGSLFTVRVPASDRSRASDAREDSLPVSRSRILVLDDEPAIAELAAKTLVRDGHFVESFTDPARALAALGEAPTGFDVIVTDYAMPDMNGLDFLRRARRIGSDASFVVMSGYLLEERDALADDVMLLSKPFTGSRLRAAVGRAALRPGERPVAAP